MILKQNSKYCFVRDGISLWAIFGILLLLTLKIFGTKGNWNSTYFAANVFGMVFHQLNLACYFFKLSGFSYYFSGMDVLQRVSAMSVMVACFQYLQGRKKCFYFYKLFTLPSVLVCSSILPLLVCIWVAFPSTGLLKTS